jgi:hypothetical protein
MISLLVAGSRDHRFESSCRGEYVVLITFPALSVWTNIIDLIIISIFDLTVA